MKNTFVKVLSMMMALMMVVGMFSIVTVSAAECAHDNVKSTVVPPSCGSIGYTKNVCPDCGEEWISNPVDELGDHSWREVARTEATCTAPGYDKHEECTVCGETNPEDLSTIIVEAQKPHAFHETVVIPMDCAKGTDGYTTKKCAYCGLVDYKDDEVDYGQVTDVVPAKHSYEYKVVEYPNANKCESGFIRVTCTVCGDTYDIVEENKHEWKDITPSVDRTQELYKNVPQVGEGCEFKYKAGKYCITCGAVDNSSLKLNDKNVHDLKEVDAEENKTEAWYLGATIPAGKVNATLLNMEWNGKKFGAGTATSLAASCTGKGYEIKYCLTCKDYVLVDDAKKACAVTGDKDSDFTVSDWMLNGVAITGTHATLGAYATMTPANLNKTIYHCQTLTRVSECKECHVKFNPETKAALDHDYDWTVKDADNKDVQMGTVHTDKTCTVNGYTTETCEFCKDIPGYKPVVTVAATDVAKGEHTWSATPVGYKDGFDCTNSSTYTGAVIYVCIYENCDVKDDPNTTEVEVAKDYRNYSVAAGTTAKHDYEKKTQEATCVADAYYYNECKRCGFIPTGDHADVPKDKPAAGVDEDNHVVKTKADLALAGNKKDGVAQPLKTGTEATCTAAQVNVYLCACGKPVDIEMVAAKNHKDTTVKFTDTNYNGKFDATEQGVAAFAGNCQQKAVKQGEYCTACNTIVTKSEIGDKVPGTHYDTNPTDIETVLPTCTDKGYDQKYYTCCGDILKVNFKDAVAENHKYEEVAVKPATCYGTGTQAHFKCAHCGKLFTEENAAKGTTLADLVIKQLTDADGNPGHKWGTVVPKVEETCDQNGTNAYQICQNPGCGEYLIGGKVYKLTYVDNDPTKAEIVVSAALKIEKHGDANMGFHKGKAPTCDEDGYTYPAYYCCSKCDVITIAKIDAELANNTALTDDEKEDLKELKASLTKLGHKNKTAKKFPGKYVDGVWVEINDCTSDSFVEYYCPDCEHSWLDDFQKAGHATHTLKNEKGEWINTELVWDTNVAANQKECLSTRTYLHKCSVCDYKEVGETVAIKPHTASVNNTDIEISYACDEYTAFLNLFCKYCGVYVTKANAEHNPIKSVVSATCTTDGHVIHYCGNGCNFYTKPAADDYFPATKHPGKVVVARVPATVDAPGSITYSCPVCALVWDEPIEQLAAPAVVTVTANATTVTAGTSITVTVDFNEIDVKFNVLELVLNTNGMFIASDVNATATGFGTNVEVIADENKVQIYPSVTSETVAINADSNASVTFTLTALDSANGKVDVVIDTITAVNATADGVKETNVRLNCNKATVAANMIGNVNGDTMVGTNAPVINAADYKETYLYAQQVKIGAAEYNAKYDIDCDNDVDFDDAMALKTFILSDKTAVDYMIMLGYEFDSLKGIAVDADFTALVGKDLAALCQFDKE